MSVGAFHSTKNSEISGPKLNGTVKIPGKVFKNLGMRFQGRFPFNKNHRFKFPEFSLVEWNASDRFPEFLVMCFATQGMLGEKWRTF